MRRDLGRTLYLCLDLDLETGDKRDEIWEQQHHTATTTTRACSQRGGRIGRDRERERERERTRGERVGGKEREIERVDG